MALSSCESKSGASRLGVWGEPKNGCRKGLLSALYH